MRFDPGSMGRCGRVVGCASVAIGAALVAPLPAQQSIGVIAGGGGPNSQFGVLDSVGDLDGDGHPDVLYGVPDNAGAVYVARATGEPILAISSTVALTFLGRYVSGIGDLDLDGVPDLLARAGDSVGEIRAYSGRTGQLLFTAIGPPISSDFGRDVDELGDVDGDGIPDFAAGSRKSAYIVSGAGGAILSAFDGIAFDGVTVGGLGDVTGDGVGDLAIGAPTASASVLQGAPGIVYVRSGASGAVVFQREGDSPFARYGFSVRRAGDVDSDLRADVLVSSFASEPSGSFGRVEAISPAIGSVLRTFLGTAPGDVGASGDGFGGAVSTVGDIDGDGVPDLVIGAPSLQWLGPGAGGAFLESAGAGQALGFPLVPGGYGDFWGNHVAGVGDVDGDAIPDFALSSSSHAEPGPLFGSIRTYSGKGDTVASYGNGCPGSLGAVPALAASIQGGNALTLDVTQGLPGALGFVFVGPQVGHAAVGYGCTLWMQSPLSSPLVIVLGGGGSFHLASHLPQGWIGYAMLQAFLGDGGAPGGFTATAAVQVAHH